MCKVEVVAGALRKAEALFERAPVENKTAGAFEKFLTRVCWGPDAPDPPDRPAVPPYSTPSYDGCEGLGETVSTVITASTLCRLMSRDDQDRFAVDHQIDVPGDYSQAVGAAWMEKLARLPAQQKWFNLKPDQGSGTPLVWFTRGSEFEQLLRSFTPNGANLADKIRDHLGLIHHGPCVYGSSLPNHLFVLHIPATVVHKAGHWRPSAIEGINNRRFLIHGPESGSAWGRTVDLDSFAKGESRGGSERVLLRLQRDLFQDGERLAFDYIGRVTNVRGNSAADDDPAFLKVALRDRKLDDLILPLQ